MELIKISEISAKIMTLADEAEELFIAVSPYVRISKWDKMKKKLESLSKLVQFEFYVRADQPESIQELTAIGVRPQLVPHLHCKLYFNEKVAIVSSMNLLLSSEVSSIEVAYQTETEEEYRELFLYFVKNVRGKAQGLSVNAAVENCAKVKDGSTGVAQDDPVLQKHLARLTEITRVTEAFLRKRNLFLVTEKAQYECSVGREHGERRLRITCTLTERTYQALLPRRQQISDSNFYCTIKFARGGGGTASRVLATGDDVVDFDSLPELLEHDYMRCFWKLYYFIKSIEVEAESGIRL